MRIAPGVVLGCILVSCGTSERPDAAVIEEVNAEPFPTDQGFAPLEFAQVDDNLKHDTLLIQVTFDMGDGSFIMVASNVEDTFEGVRLYRYKFKPGGNTDVVAVSSPGYDSWTMLPTFFSAGNTHDNMWLLANMGERESWGQKLLWMDRGFSDRGFMDVAFPERVIEDDTLRLRRRNIGPSVRTSEQADTTYFRFACDSIFLYDDQAGGYDQVVPASKVYFTWNKGEGLALWMDGAKRLVQKPA